MSHVSIVSIEIMLAIPISCRPEVQTTNYDGEISRKIVEFFIKNYEAIWTPPESLRREVEDKVRCLYGIACILR